MRVRTSKRSESRNARVVVAQQVQEFVDSVSAEYSQGLLSLHDLGPAVTVFGSARSKPGDAVYSEALLLGRHLAKAGFAVVTGGGGGVMEAANRGAALMGGGSVGMPIVLPFESHGNVYTNVSVWFDHFPARKTCLIRACDAVVVFAGGFGTLDELFEVLTLIQTGKIPRIPVVLVGSYYWAGLGEWLLEHVAAQGFISDEDLDLIAVVDSAASAAEAVVEAIERIRSTPPHSTPPHSTPPHSTPPTQRSR